MLFTISRALQVLIAISHAFHMQCLKIRFHMLLITNAHEKHVILKSTLFPQKVQINPISPFYFIGQLVSSQAGQVAKPMHIPCQLVYY